MLKFYSVEKLNKVSKRKELWCFGCGKRFHDMLRFYQHEPFLSRISILIDGNSSLWGIEKNIGEKKIQITSYDNVRQFWNKKVMLLLTTDHYQEIYTFVAKEFGKRNILCCKYPDNYYTYSKVMQFIMRFFPVKRQIIFAAGDEPHENAKAIASYLIKEYKGKPYKLIFLDKTESRIKSNFPGVTVVCKDTLRCKSSFKANLNYCWRFSTSRFLIYENEPLKKIHRRQKLIFLNHGTIPLKDVHDVLKQPDEVDFAVCPSRGSMETYVRQYGIPAEKHLYMLPPRADLVRKSKHLLEKIIAVKERQVLIWLPTFRTLRGSNRKDSVHAGTIPFIENRIHIEIMNKKLCENNQLLLIKNHPKEKECVKIPDFCTNIVLLTDEELSLAGLTLQEILGDTAALLTDYSGISFEYLLVGKPIGYIITDIDEYSRGFAYDNPMDYMPGKKINTVTELAQFFDEVRDGADAYKKSREKLMNQLYQGNEQKSGTQELIRFLDHL